ncbi:MAG: hypothetical protein JJE04_03340, partial [Acidobacteriia bacterium]|nr:hypothetical protein [Terriglobia bacterium]
MRPVLALTLLLCASGAAQHPDYFPLQVGNQWVYRVGGTRAAEPLVLSIARSEVFDGVRYVLLEGWPRGNYWLREDEQGNVYSFDTEARRERLWYSFFASVGQVYRNELPWCCGQGRIASKSADYKGPIGEVSTALEVGDPAVFQIGLVRELFLPYIGMLHRMENTGGPSMATYDLIYARLGGITVVEEKQVSFRLTLDRGVYVSDQMPPVTPQRTIPQMTARITLRQTQDAPLDLKFGSAQVYDLIIRNGKGEQVYLWSENKRFIQQAQTIRFDAGESNYVIVVPLSGQRGVLPAGRYTAEA